MAGEVSGAQGERRGELGDQAESLRRIMERKAAAEATAATSMEDVRKLEEARRAEAEAETGTELQKLSDEELSELLDYLGPFEGESSGDFVQRIMRVQERKAALEDYMYALEAMRNAQGKGAAQPETEQPKGKEGEDELTETETELLKGHIPWAFGEGGEPKYSPKTMREWLDKIDSGVEIIDPEVVELAESILKARGEQAEEESQATREVAEILQGKKLIERMKELASEGKFLEKEYERLEGIEVDDEAHQREMTQVRRALEILQGEYVALDQVRQEFIQKINQYDHRDERPVESKKEPEKEPAPVEREPRAADGTLDLNSPSDRTEAQVRAGAFERVAAAFEQAGDEKMAEKVKKMLEQLETKEQEAQAEEQGNWKLDQDYYNRLEQYDAERRPGSWKEAGEDEWNEQHRKKSWKERRAEKVAKRAERKAERLDTKRTWKIDPEYFAKLEAYNAERREGSWMEPGERERLNDELVDKAKGKSGFRKYMMRGVVLTGMMLLLTGCAVSSAQRTSIPNQQTQAITDTVDLEDLGNRAVALTAGVLNVAKDGAGNEDQVFFDLLNDEASALDLETVSLEALQAYGDAGFEGFMELEGSQINEFGVRSNYSETDDVENKSSVNAFGYNYDYLCDLDESVRNQETRSAMLNMCRNNPEALVSSIANFPTLLRACGVDEKIVQNDDVAQRAFALDNLLNAEGGGALQSRLFGALKLAFSNPNTTFEFYDGEGNHDTFYNANTGEGARTPETNQLKVERHRDHDGAIHIRVTIYYKDGAGASGDGSGGYSEVAEYKAGCGFQADVHKAQKLTISESTDGTPEVITYTYTDKQGETKTQTVVYTEQAEEQNEETEQAEVGAPESEGKQPEGEQPKGETPEGEGEKPEGEGETPEGEQPEGEQPGGEQVDQKSAAILNQMVDLVENRNENADKVGQTKTENLTEKTASKDMTANQSTEVKSTATSESAQLDKQQVDANAAELPDEAGKFTDEELNKVVETLQKSDGGALVNFAQGLLDSAKEVLESDGTEGGSAESADTNTESTDSSSFVQTGDPLANQNNANTGTGTEGTDGTSSTASISSTTGTADTTGTAGTGSTTGTTGS